MSYFRRVTPTNLELINKNYEMNQPQSNICQNSVAERTERTERQKFTTSSVIEIQEKTTKVKFHSRQEPEIMESLEPKTDNTSGRKPVI